MLGEDGKVKPKITAVPPLGPRGPVVSGGGQIVVGGLGVIGAPTVIIISVGLTAGIAPVVSRRWGPLVVGRPPIVPGDDEDVGNQVPGLLLGVIMIVEGGTFPLLGEGTALRGGALVLVEVIIRIGGAEVSDVKVIGGGPLRVLILKRMRLDWSILLLLLLFTQSFIS